MIHAGLSLSDGGSIASLVGLIIALGGFAFTLYQLSLTREAADAARDAAVGAQARFASNHLLVLLPRLQQIEDSIMSAAIANNRSLLLHLVQSWRWEAGQLTSLMSQANRRDELLEEIQRSVTLASRAKKAVASAPASTSLLDSTERLRDSIAVVTDRIGALSAAIATAVALDTPDSLEGSS